MVTIDKLNEEVLDAMTKLKQGKMSAQDAKVFSTLSGIIVSSFRVKAQVVRFINFSENPMMAKEYLDNSGLTSNR